MVRMFLLILTFLATACGCWGQRTLLMLQKRNKNKNAYYEPGDEIAFRIHGSKRKISGEILAINDSLIVLYGLEVRVDRISSLYIDEKTKWWLRFKLEQIGLLGGVGYFVLDLINNGEVDKQTLVVSGSLIGVGIVGRLLFGNRIKIQERTKLRVVNL